MPVAEKTEQHDPDEKIIEIIGEECGDSPKQVQRYIKITDRICLVLFYVYLL